MIKKNTIICEKRGLIIGKEVQHKLPNSDKAYGFSYGGKDYIMLVEGVCSYINDCTNAVSMIKKNHSLLYEKDDPTQCFDNFNYNAVALSFGAKCLVISSRDILPGEEIFMSYGYAYWKRHYELYYLLNTTRQSIVMSP